ncbi:hypothetical protein ACLMJK_007317 [Lecanora helva]
MPEITANRRVPFQIPVDKYRVTLHNFEELVRSHYNVSEDDYVQYEVENSAGNREIDLTQNPDVTTNYKAPQSNHAQSNLGKRKEPSSSEAPLNVKKARHRYALRSTTAGRDISKTRPREALKDKSTNLTTEDEDEDNGAGSGDCADADIGVDDGENRDDGSDEGDENEDQAENDDVPKAASGNLPPPEYVSKESERSAAETGQGERHECDSCEPQESLRTMFGWTGMA